MGASPIKRHIKIAVAVLIIVVMALPTLSMPRARAQSTSSQNSWTTLPPLLTACGGLGVAVVDGKIYAIGGLNANGELNINEEYTPGLNQWVTKSPMPTARSGFAVAVYNNKIYCIGGTVGSNEYVGNNEVYDPSTDTWQTDASMPTPRADLSATVVNGKIYLIGGKEYSSTSPYYTESDVNEVYDPATNTWSTAAPIPSPVYGYATTVLNGEIQIIGGSKSPGAFDGVNSIDNDQVYNPQNNTWALGTNYPNTVTYGSAVTTQGYMAPTMIYCLGGVYANSISSQVQAYNLTSNSWVSVASMPTARAYLGVVDLNDVLYAVGGFDGSNWLSNFEQYTPIGYGTVPPQLQITSPGNATYSKVILSYTVNRATDWVGYSLDNKANVTLNGSVNLFNLTQGSHHLILYGNDSLGNMGSSEVFFSVDSVPPAIVMIMPLNQSYGSTDIELDFAIRQNVTRISYSLDGQANVTIIGNVTLPALANGSHQITIYVTDQYGNEASKTIYFDIAPFPTLTVVGVAASVFIVLASTYLLIPRKKTANGKLTRHLPST